MMLLRTLVLERSDEDAPLNGALLCGFAIPQISSNFLVYSLDEETEPGNARVYVAALRKKLERFFLSDVGAQEDLQVAMQVFKQILTLAASGVKPANAVDVQIPYHFIDLKGCKLPPARPEEHHSVIIKKALVMKVITLGASAPASGAIESTSLIVPSIRFSSQMVSPPKAAEPKQTPPPQLLEQVVEPQRQIPVPLALEEPALDAEPICEPPLLVAPVERTSFFEVDSTLSSLARVSQDLALQKTAVLKQEEELEKRFSQLHQTQAELDQGRQELLNRTLEKEAGLQLRAQALESRENQLADAFASQQHEHEQLQARRADLETRDAQVHSQELLVRQKSERLEAMLAQLPGMRQNLHAMMLELDQALEGFIEQGEQALVSHGLSRTSP